MSNLYRWPSKDASYQVSIHLAERFQRKQFFRNQPIRNKNCLWWPCLLMDQDKMSILYRGPFTDASYQVSVHLAKRLEDKIFRNRPIRNKNCLWQPYLLMDWDEMSILYRGPPIDASYQVSDHLAKRFQRRRFFRNHPIRTKSMVVIFVNGSGRNDQSQQRTFHRCFLQSFGSFGQMVSEEKNLFFFNSFLFFTDFCH